ncbi:flavin-containing monooxygenase FMO GS-OX-like 9-like [Dorcoceras hygrometricum]|uniref:Flavin-containing monooxygenase n=1 Tax=Dorcoceras hygrometricum TaxID=472368 RepID=A0A2Z7D9V4_9LAMI|nr:flavin-containing monooxygenase FMO GS-OX-like 9-like [Dorcoceras hygrometricum]
MVCSRAISKKVCVIGAGPSGLVTAREMRREGHDVMVLEQNHDVGGQWLYDPEVEDEDPLGRTDFIKVHSSVYSSLRVASPREIMGFTDFPFVIRKDRDVVVVVGSSLSGQDISMELVDVAKKIHLSAKSSLTISQGLSKVISKYDNLHLHPQIESLHEDGKVLFNDGSWVIADTIIYCTGYSYSFPFLDTKGIVAIDDDRVGPLFEHTFPPSLAPSLSFVGIPRKYCDKYGDYIGFPHLEEWRKELCLSSLINAEINLETFRDIYHEDEEMLKKAYQSPHFTQSINWSRIP